MSKQLVGTRGCWWGGGKSCGDGRGKDLLKGLAMAGLKVSSNNGLISGSQILCTAGEVAQQPAETVASRSELATAARCMAPGHAKSFGQKSTLRAESRRTLLLYSDLLDWYSEAASPFAGLAQLGSVSKDWTEVRMVDTLWMGDHLS